MGSIILILVREMSVSTVEDYNEENKILGERGISSSREDEITISLAITQGALDFAHGPFVSCSVSSGS